MQVRYCVCIQSIQKERHLQSVRVLDSGFFPLLRINLYSLLYTVLFSKIVQVSVYSEQFRFSTISYYCRIFTNYSKNVLKEYVYSVLIKSLCLQNYPKFEFIQAWFLLHRKTVVCGKCQPNSCS